MLLATVLLSAALAPQAAQAPPPPPAATAPEPAPAAAPATPVAPPATETSAGPAAPYIDAGIAAFKKRRFARAKAEFEKAEEADPQSAAAAYYLGYTYYKIGEPSKRMNANKEKAKELFARAFSLDPAFNPTWGRK
jgi:tetratricopeptide (TPR) repeat protein